MPKSDVIVNLLLGINNILEEEALSGGGGLSSPGTPNTLVVVDSNGTSLKSTSTTLSSLQTVITQYNSLSYLNSSKTTLQNIISRWNTYGSWSDFDISPYISKGSTNMKYKNYDGNQMIKSNSSTTELYSPDGINKLLNIKNNEFKLAYPEQGKSPGSYAFVLKNNELHINPYSSESNTPCILIDPDQKELVLTAPFVDNDDDCGIKLSNNEDSWKGISLMYNGASVFKANNYEGIVITPLNKDGYSDSESILKADYHSTLLRDAQDLYKISLNPVEGLELGVGSGYDLDSSQKVGLRIARDETRLKVIGSGDAFVAKSNVVEMCAPWDDKNDYVKFLREIGPGEGNFEIKIDGNYFVKIDSDRTVLYNTRERPIIDCDEDGYTSFYFAPNTFMYAKEDDNSSYYHKFLNKSVLNWHKNLSNNYGSFDLRECYNGGKILSYKYDVNPNSGQLNLFYPQSGSEDSGIEFKSAINIAEFKDAESNDLYNITLSGSNLIIQIGETELTLDETKLQKLKALLEE